jgi:hypothetical protein
MEYLMCSNLNILNKGNERNFWVCNRQEVIDLTLGTNKIGNLISNWHVSDEPSLSDHRYICFTISNWHVSDEPFLSDHRYICFQIGNITVDLATYRNPKRN